MAMKRYKFLFNETEDDEGDWVKYEDHKADYIRRWEFNNAANTVMLDCQHKNSILINKLKFTIAIMSITLLISLVL